jgi:tetratricopeptide (TPR) repeat protein
MQDNCIACHMVSRPAATVQHAAQTDHSIPRRPATIPDATEIPDDTQLTPFPGSTATDRETGLAYAEEALALNNRRLGIRALDLLNPLYAAHPGDSQVADQLAQLLDKAGRQNQACEIFQRISGNGDVPAAALVNAGTCLANAGRAEDAIALWKKALEKNPAEESARLNLAVALYRAGDAAQARATLEDALRLNPFFDRARNLLAEMR